MKPGAFRLTDAELTLLSEHIGVSDPALGKVGDGDEVLAEEGLRSLVARGLCRVEEGGVALSSSLVEAAGSVIAPKRAVAISKASIGAASVGFAAFDEDRVIAHRSLMPGVHEFREVSSDEFVDAVVASVIDESAPRPEVWQVRVVEGDQVNTLSIGLDEDDELSVLSSSGEVLEVIAVEHLTDRVAGFIRGDLASEALSE